MRQLTGYAIYWLLLMTCIIAGFADPVTFTATETLLAHIPGVVEQNDIKISPNGQHIAYSLPRDGKFVIIVDGKEGPVYEPATRHDEFEPKDIIYHWLRITDEGQLSYLARRGQQEYLVIDGVEQPAYDEIQPFFLIHRHYLLAYHARRGKRWFVVMNGVEGPPCDELMLHGVVRGQPIYQARKGKRWYFAIGKELGPAYDQIHWSATSSDQQHYAFTAVRGKKACWLSTGRKQQGSMHHLSPIALTDNTWRMSIMESGRSVWLSMARQDHGSDWQHYHYTVRTAHGLPISLSEIQNGMP